MECHTLHVTLEGYGCRLPYEEPTLIVGEVGKICLQGVGCQCSRHEGLDSPSEIKTLWGLNINHPDPMRLDCKSTGCCQLRLAKCCKLCLVVGVR